jgi:hypothetical protein
MAERLTRRTALLVLASGLGAACARPTPRPTPPPEAPDTSALDAWDAEAQDVLAKALGVLHTFDTFSAYRISRVNNSSLRSPRELVWDPPTTAEWADAQDSARSLKARAGSLFQAVSTANIDPNLWRERRVLAAASRSLADMTNWLVSYQEAVATLERESDGSRALPSLSKAWEQWEASSAYWSVDTTEAIGCA